MDKNEALKMAVEALEASTLETISHDDYWDLVGKAIQACKEALTTTEESLLVKKPLSDDEIWNINKSIAPEVDLNAGKLLFARAIEQAHGIGE
jgi:hypothetical protein